MIVETKYGRIRGVKEDGYIVYKGIPYAKAPVGELRWKAPQDPEPWEGILEADHWGCRCWQSNHPKDSFWAKEFYPDEDALPERSWRPKQEEDYKLAHQMADAWAAFMKNWNPGWHPYTKEEPYVQVLRCENAEKSV